MEENFEIFLYIIFAVIALLSRLFSKKNKRPAPKGNPTPSGQPGQRPPTFEELLREFTGAGPATEIEEEPEPVTEETVFQPKERYSPVSDREARETYERSIQEANMPRAKDRKPKPEQPRKKLDHFKNYKLEDEESELAAFSKRLRSPRGAKEAFILSEIFNRKY